MRKILFILLLISFLFLLPSCGAKNPAAAPSLPEDSESIADEWVLEKERKIYAEIVWGGSPFCEINGVDHLLSLAFYKKRSEGWAFNYLYEKYNAKIYALYNSKWNPDKYVGELTEFRNNGEEGVFGPDPEQEFNNQYNPDIYNPKREQPDILYYNAFEAYQNGFSRTISKEMIEKYAPDYARLMDRENDWALNRAANGEYYGLSVYDACYNDLQTFSLYRLDWLEEVGIQPNGELIELEKGIYFTTEAFDQGEFTRSMQLFSTEGMVNNHIANKDKAYLMHDKPYGIYIDSFFSNPSDNAVRTLMGMYGVNNSIMEEDGKAVPYFATEQYKEALRYLKSLYDMDSIVVSASSGVDISTMMFTGARDCGWCNVSVEELFTSDEYYSLRQMINKEPNAKVLITPPEIGSTGKQGAAVLSSQLFRMDGAWIINKDVTDQKLARILEIFNDMSFDPETYIATNYGLEGKYYRWLGEPYESELFQLFIPGVEGVWPGNRAGAPRHTIPGYTPVGYGIGAFRTGIMDGVVGKQEYAFGYNAVYEYARSNAASQMLLKPYKEDIYDDFGLKKVQLDEQYGVALDKKVREYFFNVLKTVDVEDTWDEYIYSLKASGLDEYIEMYKQYPDLDK